MLILSHSARILFNFLSMSFRSFSSQIFSKGFFATLFLGLFAGALGGGATAALIFQQIRSEGLSEQASSAVIQFEG